MKKDAPAPDPTAALLEARKKFKYSIIWLTIGILYSIWPLDIIPDSFPVVGWIDDISLLLATFTNSGLRYWRLKSKSGPTDPDSKQPPAGRG